MKRQILSLILALALLGFAATAWASERDSLWSHAYGGGDEDEASCILASGDGGFLISGTTASYGAGDHDLWLVKVSATGDLLWSRTYGGSGWDGASAIIPSGDGNFLLAGRTSSFGAGDYDAWLIKVTTQGDSLWSRTYGGSAWDGANSIIPSGDGGFLLAGWTMSFGAGDRDMWLVKVNAQGDSLWSHTYGGSDLDGAYSIIPAGDGCFLLAGRSYSFGVGGSEDAWLVKVDAEGDSLWSQTYGGIIGDWATSIVPAGDGGFLLAGWVSSFGSGWYDMWLVKVNAQGDSLWSRTYGGLSYEAANCLTPAGDGGFLLAGWTYTFGAGWSDVWLVKVNAQGDSLWSRTFGGSGYDMASAVISTGEGYLVTGWTWSFSAGLSDFWLVKVDGIPDLTVTTVPVNPPIQIPATGGSFNYNISLANSDLQSETFDAWCMVQLPNQTWNGPVLGPLSLTLPPSATISRLRTQNVPASAAAGEYLYEVRTGDYPSIVWASDNFPFSKLGVDGWDLGTGGWMNTGEEFDVGARHAVPTSGSGTTTTTAISPNPFNPTTAISYKLQAASHVSLRVYDTAGRLVTTLVDGWREAGEHRVTFDGSGLPSGVYLYRLTAGEQTESGKMVLLK